MNQNGPQGNQIAYKKSSLFLPLFKQKYTHINIFATPQAALMVQLLNMVFIVVITVIIVTITTIAIIFIFFLFH